MGNGNPRGTLWKVIQHSGAAPTEIDERRQRAALEVAAEVIAGVELALKHYRIKTGALGRQSERASRRSE